MNIISRCKFFMVMLRLRVLERITHVQTMKFTGITNMAMILMIFGMWMAAKMRLMEPSRMIVK